MDGYYDYRSIEELLRKGKLKEVVSELNHVPKKERDSHHKFRILEIVAKKATVLQMEEFLKLVKLECCRSRRMIKTTLLSVASRDGHLKLVRNLLEKGANVNCLDYQERTALINASRGGHVDCVKTLLKTGADVNRQTSRTTALQESACFGHTICVQVLLNAGACVNVFANGEDTALLGAISRTGSDIVNLLIDAGADVNVQGWDGVSPILKALRNENEDCFLALLVAGADVNIPDNRGNTTLMQAAMEGFHQCLKLLLKAGADVNTLNGNGMSPLFAAAYSLLPKYDYSDPEPVKTEKCMRILLRANAQINHVNEIGQNALGFILNQRDEYKDMAILLFIAGEIMDENTIVVRDYRNKNGRRPGKIPEYLKQIQFQLCLKHLCRETIRKHIIQLNPNRHLFYRIPQIGLPSSLTYYLLYYALLEEDEKAKKQR